LAPRKSGADPVPGAPFSHQQASWYCLGLKSYLRDPGDGRRPPEILAQDLVWALLIHHILRAPSFAHMEGLVPSPARPAQGVVRTFGDDALAYFTERQDPEATRKALAAVLRPANGCWHERWLNSGRGLPTTREPTESWPRPPFCMRPTGWGCPWWPT
jgi:hypothetical protein